MVSIDPSKHHPTAHHRADMQVSDAHTHVHVGAPHAHHAHHLVQILEGFWRGSRKFCPCPEIFPQQPMAPRHIVTRFFNVPNCQTKTFRGGAALGRERETKEAPLLMALCNSIQKAEGRAGRHKETPHPVCLFLGS
jgi:hypothetical protein